MCIELTGCQHYFLKAFLVAFSSEERACENAQKIQVGTVCAETKVTPTG